MIKNIRPRPQRHPDTNTHGEWNTTHNTTIINNTGLRLAVIFADGLHAVLEPRQNISNFEDGLTFQIQHRSQLNNSINSLSFMDSGDHDKEQIKESLDEDRRRPTYVSRYVIPTQEVRDSGSGLYLQNLDVLVVRYTGQEIPKHPRHEKSHHQFIEPAIESTFSISVIVIDNYMRLNRPFVNFGGKTIKIEPTRQPHLPDGVYILRTVDSDGVRDVECERFDIGDKENPVRFYSSRSEAESNGDVLERMKREYEIERQTLKNNELAAQQSLLSFKEQVEQERSAREREYRDAEMRIRAEMEDEKSRRKAAEDELSHERKLREYRSKDHYEERANQRKDMTEWLKTIPAVLSFVTLMITVANKGKS